MSHDANLLKHARAYAAAIKNAVVRSDQEFLEVIRKGSFSSGQHGTIEFTPELRNAAQKLTERAKRIHGHARVHERSVDELARRAALKFGVNDPDDKVAVAICDELAADVSVTRVVVRPNRIIRLHQDVSDVRIGPVRVLRRKDISKEILGNHADVQIIPFDGLATQILSEEPDSEKGQLLIGLTDLCWVVTVQGMTKQLDDTVRWMIDVTVSFIRLHYTEAIGFFPRVGDAESHPIDVTKSEVEGFHISDDRLSTGRGDLPPWYEIDAELAGKITSPSSCKKLSNLLDPQRDTVAERVQQMLGWLTRGRRTGDAAERVLFFFTAIEALLSSKSVDGPVTQTIARYAAVIISDDVLRRPTIAKEVIALYAVRSRIVHRGERAVAMIEANRTHLYAWQLAAVALDKVDLSATHSDFIEELKLASYGSEWPPRAEERWIDPAL